jgi:hypothetical protein
MKTTRKLHEIGQSLWLDNITRGCWPAAPFNAIFRNSRSQGSPRTPRSSITPSKTVVTMTLLSARR